MRKSDLRAAAQNLADSLSSEDSAFLSYAYPGLWEHIDRLPDRRLSVDLLTGETTAPWVPDDLQDLLRLFASQVPRFLASQRCDPDAVAAIRVEYRRSEAVLPSRQEAIISIEQTDGTTIVDRYIGCPLKRPRYLDALGRVRTDRGIPLK